MYMPFYSSVFQLVSETDNKKHGYKQVKMNKQQDRVCSRPKTNNHVVSLISEYAITKTYTHMEALVTIFNENGGKKMSLKSKRKT